MQIKKIFLIGVIHLALTSTAYSEINLVHKQITPSELAYPGKLMTLSLKLNGTKQTSRKVRALVVRDGRLMELWAYQAIADENDVPEYKFTINSPVRELSYSFIVYNADGTTTSSKRYKVERACLPDTHLAEIKAPPEDSPGEQRLLMLIQQSRSLERDLDTYDKALGLIQELEELVKE